MGVRKIHEYALQREHEGKQFFEQNAERFSDAAVVEALQRLAVEEEQHICFIQGLLARLDATDASGVEGEHALEAGDLFSQRTAVQRRTCCPLLLRSSPRPRLPAGLQCASRSTSPGRGLGRASIRFV